MGMESDELKTTSSFQKDEDRSFVVKKVIMGK